MNVFAGSSFLSTSAILTHHLPTLCVIAVAYDGAGRSCEVDRELHSGGATPLLCRIDWAPRWAALMWSRGPPSCLPLASLLPSSLWRKCPWTGQVPGFLLSISDPIAHVHPFSYADFTAVLLFFWSQLSCALFVLFFLHIVNNFSTLQRIVNAV